MTAPDRTAAARTAPAGDAADVGDAAGPDGTATGERVLRALCWVAIVVGVGLRFVPRPDLWLDEALSVNIAGLPLGELRGALRRDGHPPLYYVLLHLWTAVGGDGTWWVRALSGVVGVASVPVAWLAGARTARRSGGGAAARRRAGLLAAAVVAVLPYGVRYGSEARMYALVILLVLVGYLAADDLLAPGGAARSGRSPVAATAVGALAAAALLWTHYWSMWLLAAVGLLAVWCWWRAGRLADAERHLARRGAVLAVGAVAAAAVAFLPWVPTLLFQSERTGTPWGEVNRPTTMLLVTVVDFAGRAVAEPQLLSYVLVLLVLLGLAGVVVRGARGDAVVQLEPRTVPRVRAELVVLLLAMGIGWATSALAGGTFHPRYAAVVFPLFALAVAAGLGVLRGSAVAAVAVAAVLAGSVVSVGTEVLAPRTQAGDVADEIVRRSGGNPDGAVVVTCPDQLAPAAERALRTRTGRDWEVIPFPAGGDARFVDWVDYAERNRAATPEDFVARELDRLPPDTTIYYVLTTGYLTFGDKCEQLVGLLGDGREGGIVVEPDGETFYENMGVAVFRPGT